MDAHLERLLTRRRFFELAGTGIGTAALATLFGQDLLAQAPGGGVPGAAAGFGALPGLPHHAPKARRIIYLFQSGAPRSTSCGTTSPPSRGWSARTCPRRCAATSASPP